MARNKNGIMGQVSGKVGTIVGVVDKYGRTFFRARDVQAANSRTVMPLASLKALI